VQKKLERVRTNVTASNIDSFNSLKKRLDRLLIQDDIYWKQRVKSFWYRDGDLNTKYFHAAATSRKKVNIITLIENSNGVVCRKEEDLQTIARDYFSNIFT